MLKELKKEANYTLTKNGALAYKSTMDYCLDLFATAGGLRNASSEEIIGRFIKAYAENPDIAMKILFYARDIREGLGERRFFREIIKFLAENNADSIIKNLERVSEYGRYDDLLILIDTPCEEAVISFLEKKLREDINYLEKDKKNISLLAKWLPSVNTSNRHSVYLGRKLAKAFGMSEKEYRKTLSALRKEIDIIENYLREVDYTFDYEKQPGKALLKYRKAFYSHDENRYIDFLDKVNNHEAVMHTGTLMPYEIIKPIFKELAWGGADISIEDIKSIETTWYAQEDFAGEQNSLVVIDGSGSMYCYADPMPITVAHSLGLYFAEKNTGAFAGDFITFSNTPQLVEIKGKSLLEKIKYMTLFDEIATTNIQSVFELILKTAVKNKIPQEKLPERIFIISDMEFNSCTKNADITNFEYAKSIFLEAGYKLPKVIFWNVGSSVSSLPVTKNEQGVTLVSGCNARLFKQVLSDNTDPYAFMMEILSSKRYEKIVA